MHPSSNKKAKPRQVWLYPKNGWDRASTSRNNRDSVQHGFCRHRGVEFFASQLRVRNYRRAKNRVNSNARNFQLRPISLLADGREFRVDERVPQLAKARTRAPA